MRRLTDLSADVVLLGLPARTKYNPGQYYDYLAAGPIAESLLERALGTSSWEAAAVWRREWLGLLTPRIRRAIIICDREFLDVLIKRCQHVHTVLVIQWQNCEIQKSPENWFNQFPNGVECIDFDGELFFRGRLSPSLTKVFEQRAKQEWIQEAQELLNGLATCCMSPPIRPSKYHGLQELHLGCTSGLSPAILARILRVCPLLVMLRHYQLAAGLCHEFGAQWRHGSQETLPTLRLRNIDVDFSHVVRCRMSPESVLPGDALSLCVALCPDAQDIRVRFDCLTPHDALSPLLQLTKLTALSVVCVSSGERTRLDFTDISAVLERHGPKSLQSLELKVVEEVDVHVIISSGFHLETLVLSGCGHRAGHQCQDKCAIWTSLPLPKLRHIFFADGDDFSWDHLPPPCFWRAVFALDGESKSRERLEAVFLESPRIDGSLANQLFPISKWPLYPDLQVLSVCRCSELNIGHFGALSGLSVPPSIASSPTIALRYLRLSDCSAIDFCQKNLLREWASHFSNPITLVLSED